MTMKVFTDRSRVEQFQLCPRKRWLEYHSEGGTGIVSASKPLPLAVGGAVHSGLEVLLREGNKYYARHAWDKFDCTPIEDNAVAAAIADLSRYRGHLELDATETAAQAATAAISDDQMRQQLAESLGLPVEDAGLGALLSTQSGGRKVFDDYLWQEQSSLVEGMVRAYARRRLRPLLEEFEVLEVEREGEWELATGDYGAGAGYLKYGENWAGELSDPYSIAFMSRPDALLRSRVDNSLYLMSFKTAATWDRRKELDAQHDMQGLSEGVEVERRLGEWWIQINDTPDDTALTECCKKLDIEYCTGRYLKSIPAPPRILGIRYEYMLKGYRGKDKELSAKLGFDCWSQRSHLVRKYVARSTPVKGSAFSLGDECWSYDYLKEDGGTTNLYYGHWKSEPVDDVKVWIDKLDQSEEVMSAYDSTVGQDPRSLGWKSAGQTLGFTVQHPLNAIFIPPITVYRSDDQLRDWLEQVEAQEVKVAESVVLVAAATDEDERRSLLNILFPQSRRACEYPSTCGFCAKGQDVCFGGEDIRARPLESGKFVRRVPNHPQELV